MVRLLNAAIAVASFASFGHLARADDTSFTVDPRLHRSFWGIAYTYVAPVLSLLF